MDDRGDAEPETTVRLTASEGIDIDRVLAESDADGAVTGFVIIGDNFGEDLAVAAGGRILDADVVSAQELRIELPQEAVDWADVSLSIRSVGPLDTDLGVYTETFVVRSAHGGLAGDGDTDY
jgi:hypothetical protein